MCVCECVRMHVNMFGEPLIPMWACFNLNKKDHSTGPGYANLLSRGLEWLDGWGKQNRTWSPDTQTSSVYLFRSWRHSYFQVENFHFLQRIQSPSSTREREGTFYWLLPWLVVTQSAQETGLLPTSESINRLLWFLLCVVSCYSHNIDNSTCFNFMKTSIITPSTSLKDTSMFAP